MLLASFEQTFFASFYDFFQNGTKNCASDTRKGFKGRYIENE
jgi:hypothetical protein